MHVIFSTPVSSQSLATLRDRTRQLGELVGLDTLQLTRCVTAVSEIARNTVQYAGVGTATFLFNSASGAALRQELVVQLSDQGPGIADLQDLLEGRATGRAKAPMGIIGSRRLVDALSIECPADGGTVVTIAMTLPRQAPRLEKSDIIQIVEKLERRKPQTPMEALERQNRDLLHALSEQRLRQLDLKEADERKNQFLATLAHELRNPLGTLQMSLELLRRKRDIAPDELAQRVELMSRQTVQLTRLVDDLMDVSRVSLGKVQLDMQSLTVNELVADAVEMAGAAVAAKGHTASMKAFAEPLWIYGDASRLRQVLVNMLSNAARYTPEGGVIAIEVRREGASAVIDIIDNGIGIAAELLPQVFDLYVQGKSGRDNTGGLGVGLTLVQRLVQDHGGTVSVTSPGVGQGSCFTVTLPLSPQRHGTGQALDGDERASSSADTPS